MSRDAHIDLANRALDGDLTKQELADFEAALKTNPALREIQRSIAKADVMMREATSVEPPPELRQNVLRAVKARHAARASHSGWLERLTSKIRHKIEIKPSVGIGLGFAMGVLLLAGLSTVTDIPWNSVGAPEAVGTIGNRQITDKEAVSKAIDISVDGKFTGLAEYVWSDRSLNIEISLDSPEAVIVTLEFDPTGLEIVSIAGLSESVTDMNYSEGSISIAHGGSGSFNLVFEQQNRNIEDMKLSVSQAGDILKVIVIELR